MTDPNSHNDTITITITLDAISSGQRGFSSILMIANDVSLNSAVVASYSSLAEVSAALTAGYVSQAVVDAATAIFGQTPKIDTFKVASRDTSGTPDTYLEALDAAKAVDPDFYAIILEDRTPALSLVIAADVEADEDYLLICQDNDADWLTSSIPSAWSAAAGYERTVIMYHSSDTADDDAALAGNRLAWDPDETSAGWTCSLATGSNTSAVTATQKGFIRANNANVALPYGPTAQRWVDPGVNLAGRGIYEIVSADWFKARLREEVASTVVALAARGQKLPVTPAGQAVILAKIEALLAKGVAAGHFVAGQTTASGIAITSSDETNRRLRFTASAQVVGSARLLDFAIDFSQNAVVTA